nr:macro domain-containing protein [Neorhizobium tomejilense]
MAIEYVEGDLLASDEDVVIHGCNVRGGFDTGFAGVVRKRHPLAMEIYMDHHRKGGLILGSVIWAFDGRLIGNALTQPTYGRTGQHVSYDAVRSCMKSVAMAAVQGVPGTPYSAGFDRVSMPLIGSQRGGGDWDVIERIIDEELPKLKTVVYVLPGAKPSASVLSSRPRR